MTLECICSLRAETAAEYEAVSTNLKAVEATGSDLAYTRVSRGYAQYTSSGYIADSLVTKLGRQPTPLEIAMLVDGGYSWFGGNATYNQTTGTFTVTIYTD